MKNVRKKAVFLLPVMIILSLALAACSSGENGSGENGQLAAKQQLNVTTTADIPTLDYTQATDTQSLNTLEMVNSGLTRMHNDKVQWDLAAGAPKVSKDKKVYTFKLRKGIEWSDGKPVTAQDFVYGWRHENDPKAKPAYNFLYASANIANAARIQNPKDPLYGKVEKLGIKALDSKTIQISFDKPAPPFLLSLLSTAGFFPQRKDFLEKQGEQYARGAKNLLYNGPFKLESWTQGKGWTYVKNKNYWNASHIHLTRINVKIAAEQSTRVNLYKTGQSDIIENLAGDFIDQFKKTNPKELHSGLTATTRFLFINEKTNKNLRNIHLRRALNEAIDRSGFVNVLMKNGSIASHFAVPKNFVAGPDGKDFRSAAPEGYLLGGKSEAKKEWERAKKELGIKTLNLTLLSENGDQFKQFDEYFANQIETKLKGIHVSINQQPFGNFLKLQTKFNFDLSYGGWAPDYKDPLTYLDMFTTGNPQNASGWSNKKFDQLIASAGSEASEMKRWKLLQEAEKELISQAVIIPLDQEGQTRVQKPFVKGLNYPLYGPKVDFTGTYILKH